MAVDPSRGYLFLADTITVRRFNFTVTMGKDYMTPKLTLSDKSIVVFRDDEVSALSVDQDHSILYVASKQGITMIEYPHEILLIKENGRVTLIQEN
jgi:hypothetical protein